MGEKQEGGISADHRSHGVRAADALEEAREMPPGPRRTEALKKAAFLVERLTISN
jgi:hypothetical protein